MSKKTKVIILVIVLVVLVVAVVGGIFAYQYVEENKSVGSTWGDTYYAYLKEASEQKDSGEAESYGLQTDMKNAKLQFCEVEENKAPSMIMTYEKDNQEYVNVYKINEEEKVEYITYNKPAKLELLYNIELNQYIWYLHTEEENSDTYCSLNGLIGEITSEASDTTNINSEYTIQKDDATTQETVDGEILILLKFDETFVKPEIDESNKIDFNINFTAKEIRNAIVESVEKYTKDAEIITEEVEKVVQEKVEIVENKKQEIETAKEEVAKKEEEEAKKKAEEEAKQKAEEATKKAQEEATKATTTTTTTTSKISEQQARKLAEKIDGTYAEEADAQIGYTLEAMVKDSTGLEYYLFRVRWLVNGDHWSTIDGVAISVDGKKWKQVDIYQNYKNGQTIQEVYKEGNF